MLNHVSTLIFDFKLIKNYYFSKFICSQKYIKNYIHLFLRHSKILGCYNWLLMQTFYHGLTNSTRETTDVAASVAFLSPRLPATTALVEKMASSQGWNEE
jgi:hypothetical protein